MVPQEVKLIKNATKSAERKFVRQIFGFLKPYRCPEEDSNYKLEVRKRSRKGRTVMEILSFL